MRLARVRYRIAEDDDREFELNIEGQLFVVDRGLLVPVPEPAPPEPEPRGPSWHWVQSTGIWHAYRSEGPPPWPTLCGRHQVPGDETKTPGGLDCRECVDLAGLPADHWRRQWLTAEGKPS